VKWAGADASGELRNRTTVRTQIPVAVRAYARIALCPVSDWQWRAIQAQLPRCCGAI